MMQEQLSQKEKEIKKLKKAIEVSEEKRQELEQNHEVKLQKTIRHIRTEMEQSNEARIGELKAEHQAEINRMLETSRGKFYSSLNIQPLFSIVFYRT